MPWSSHNNMPQPQGEESIIDIYLQADDLHLLAGQSGLQVGQVTPQATDNEIFLGQGGIPLRLQIHRDMQQLVKIVSVRLTANEEGISRNPEPVMYKAVTGSGLHTVT